MQRLSATKRLLHCYYRKEQTWELKMCMASLQSTCVILSFKVPTIYSLLSQHPTWKTIVFSDGKTKLLDFIGAMQTADGFRTFLNGTGTNVNMFVPLDSPICAGYTPLHLCVICSEKPPNYNDPEEAGYPADNLVSYDPKKTSLYATRIKKCLAMGANICTQDARGSTPLHWAFRVKKRSLVDLLLGYHKQFDNPTNEDGLSHLHIASASGNKLAVRKLLRINRADVNSQVKIHHSWDRDGRRFVAKSGSTPLHSAGATKHLQVMGILIDCGADALAVDDDNFNPVERLLGVRLSVDNPAFCPKPCKLLDTLELILQSEDQLHYKILTKVGMSRLHVACMLNDVKAVRESLLRDDVDVDVGVADKSADWSGMTPLLCYLGGIYVRCDKSPDLSIAEMLLQRGADVMKIRRGGTVVHKAFEMHCYKGFKTKNLRLLKLLLSYQRDFSVNSTASSGLSHFHIACACNEHEMVMEFLKNGADVNQKIDYFCEQNGGNTPLHIAAIYKSNETVDVLLQHGADVTSTNSYNSTPLHVATKTRFENLYIMRALLRAGADVNATNILGATPVEVLINCRNCTKEEIDVCLKNGFKADVFNPITKQGCLGQALADQRNSELVYKMLIESTDLTRLDGRNCNAIHIIVSVDIPDFMDLPDDGVVDEAFTPTENYTKAIEELMKINVNIDQQDSQGKTPLHYATRMVNVTAILSLLENGADFNLSDESGKTAFEHHMDSYNDPEFCFEEVYKRILDIFTAHAWKLAGQNLEVNTSIKKLLREHKKRKVLSSTGKRCHTELSKLRDERIESCRITLFDFLSETNAIIHFQRIPIDERVAVEEFFENKTEYLRENFPEFAGILILQYRKALKRVDIMPLALDSISVLVGFEMP